MKKNLKKHAASALIATMVLSGGTIYADSSMNAEVTSGQVTTTQFEAADYGITMNGQASLTTGFMNKDNHIMLPLREVAEALGFEVQWNQKNNAAELTLPQSAIWTLVKVDVDQYAYNKMNKSLGAAPINLNGKLFVPSSFFSEILRTQVSIEGNQVELSFQNEDIVMYTQNGVITTINNEDNYQSIRINGVGMEGIVLNIDENTVFKNSSGEQISIDDLSIGMNLEVKHSMAMTMSLPPQTYAYEITVQDSVEEAAVIGTSGVIQEVRLDDEDNMSIAVKGTGMTEQSPEEVVLRVSADTIIVDSEGNQVEKSVLTKDAKVLTFYSPALTKSLPPIGNAWKVVYLGVEEGTE